MRSDRFAPIAAGLELWACILNAAASLMWLTMLMLVLVGFLWLVPLGLALVEACLALFSLVKGQHRFAVAGPIVGVLVSLCSLNPIAFCMQVGAIVLFLKANQARAAELLDEDPYLAAVA